MIVTIDGPAGAGKSTVAKTIAAKLGYLYLDSGALYRAVAWKALATGTDPTAPVAMKRLCQEIRLEIAGTPDGGMEVSIDGSCLTAEIRTPAVTKAAGQVAALPGIREALLPIQQAFGRRTDVRGVVAEGRDLGTVVFPRAEAKFFFHADPAERARRRHAELMVAGKAVDLAETRRDLDARDYRDQTREVAPLAAPQDAVVIDTTQLSIDEIVERMLAVIEAKSPGRR